MPNIGIYVSENHTFSLSEREIGASEIPCVVAEHLGSYL